MGDPAAGDVAFLYDDLGRLIHVVYNPFGVAVDSQGNVFVADSSNNVIRKVGSNGTITTVAGTGEIGFAGDGGPATSSLLNFPPGVAVDSQGNLFVADSSNSVIRKVGSDGTITTVAGTGESAFGGDGGPATSAQLSVPFGVAVDSQGDLFVADTFNNRVRKVSADGTIQTVAGVGVFALALGSVPIGRRLRGDLLRGNRTASRPWRSTSRAC